MQRDDEHAAGCTLLVDAETGLIRYQIEKTTAAGRARRTLLKRASAGRCAPSGATGRLRVFAFDPSLGVELETAGINEVTLAVPWERDARADILQPGPVGEYVEVVDHDPGERCFYEPVDLNDRAIVAQDGLQPSESNPQFHQQMVYAVAMRTIRNFERALGRLALWSPRRDAGTAGSSREEYVPRLRIYPHALREANAYYSPSKKALLFGYFPAAADDGRRRCRRRSTVFTCLTHDIVAHEIDARAARRHPPPLQRAEQPRRARLPRGVRRHRRAVPALLAARGAAAPDRRDARRPREPEPARRAGAAVRPGDRQARRAAQRDRQSSRTREDYRRRVLEPHDRGAILVAAVFDAFLTIYKVARRRPAADRERGHRRPARGAAASRPRQPARRGGRASPRSTCSRCASARSTTARRSTSPSATTCARSSPPTSSSTRSTRSTAASRSPRRSAAAASSRDNVRTLSVDGLLWRPAADAPGRGRERRARPRQELGGRHRLLEPDSQTAQELFELMREKRAALHDYLDREARPRDDGAERDRSRR